MKRAWFLLAVAGLLQAQEGSGTSSFFYGSRPSGAATAQEIPLSLATAIDRGLKTNLGLIVAEQRTRAARGARDIARSDLLPDISANMSQASEQINLAAFGFSSFPGIAPIVGPFSLFDIRGQVSQTLFDRQALDRTKARASDIRASELQTRDAREAVTLVVTALYLQAVSGASRVEAARAQVTTATALYNQASEFKKAGTVPAIDVLRAQVEMQSRQQKLITFENDNAKQKLRLARAIGLPDGQLFRLTNEIPYEPVQAVSLEPAMQRAFAERKDYQSLAARVESARLSVRAAGAGRLPTLEFNGDYGAIGRSPVSAHGTYTARVNLHVPIFQGGRVKGEMEEADAEARQLEAQLDDLRGRIAFEVRSALLDLKAASERVEVSRSAAGLARQQETQARDRFAAGVTNNLEVVQAQSAVAASNEDYISSLYGYIVARASLARATGEIEKIIPSLLTGAIK
ncbi:MAG TPA: TolC family protein [Bryobacteraceae bacterium]|nr:TolC family protein [Bryobacteraceae bacterium]